MKILRVVLSLWVVAVILGQPIVHAQPSPVIQGSTPNATPTSEGLLLEWQVPAPTFTSNANGEIEVTIKDYPIENTPGALALPYTNELIALPVQGTATLEIQSISEQPIPLAGSLATVPIDGQSTPSTSVGVPTSPEKIKLVEMGTQRGVRLARVTFYPVTLKNGQLIVVSQIKILVRFSPPKSLTLPGSDPILQLIQSQVVNPTQIESVNASVTMAADVSAFSNSNAYAIEVNQPGIVQVSYDQLKNAGFPVDSINPLNLHLTLAGQEVAYEWTSAQDTKFTAGEAFRFYAKPRFSRWMVNDVYLLSVGAINGTTIPARTITSANNNPAWRDLLVEENKIYTPDCLCQPLPFGRDGDRWVWDELSQPGTSSGSYSFNVSNVDQSADASLTIWLIGKTDMASANPDHQVDLSLNGTNLFSNANQWDGKTAFAATFTIPAGALHSGSNTLVVSVPPMSGVLIDSFWMDAFNIHYRLGSASNGNEVTFSGILAGNDVAYQQFLDSSSAVYVYNITNPNLPVRLLSPNQTIFKNRVYLPVLSQSGQATSIIQNNSTAISFGDQASNSVQSYIIVNEKGIHSPAKVRALQPLATSSITGADYIIIAPDGYDQALQPLVNLRSSQAPKMVVAVEHLQAIYDQFSEGRLDPEAIRSFLKYAYNTWRNPQPAYVLLVGDANIDPKKYRSTDFDTILPTMFKDFDQYTADGATDNRFVTLSNDPAQILPDMMIGRLPANSVAEAQAMVAKIVNYEVNPVPGNWKSRTVFVAGRYFDGSASRIAKLVTPTVFNVPTQLYFLKNVMDWNVMHSSILSAWNQGASLILYTGHASVHFWSGETWMEPPYSAPPFFHITNDLDQLNNGGKLPVVLQMTCFTGTFQMGSLSSMDEQLIRKANGGALAVWGSSSEGLSNGHEYLAQGFINNITKNTANNPTHNLGLATYAGRLNVFNINPQNNNLIDSFILFGDPLSRVTIDLTPKTGVFVPLVNK